MAANTALHPTAPVLTAQGSFHQLDVYTDRLVIHRKDLMSRLFNSDDVIRYTDIDQIHIYNTSSFIGNRSELIIVFKDGKSRALMYGAQQEQLVQHIKDTIETFLCRSEA